VSDKAEVEKGLRNFAAAAGIDLSGLPAAAISTIAEGAVAFLGVLTGQAQARAVAAGKAAADAITTADQAEAAERNRR
jgi:hypothetical protein